MWYIHWSHSGPELSHPHCTSGTFVPHTFAKMSQLVRATGLLSPHVHTVPRPSKATHACPVSHAACYATGPLELYCKPRQDTFPEVVLHCEVCHEQFSDLNGCYDTCILVGVHIDWKLMTGFRPETNKVQTQYAHIVMHAFTNKPALRQHISRGQCPNV